MTDKWSAWRIPWRACVGEGAGEMVEYAFRDEVFSNAQCQEVVDYLRHTDVVERT